MVPTLAPYGRTLVLVRFSCWTLLLWVPAVAPFLLYMPACVRNKRYQPSHTSSQSGSGSKSMLYHESPVGSTSESLASSFFDQDEDVLFQDLVDAMVEEFVVEEEGDNDMEGPSDDDEENENNPSHSMEVVSVYSNATVSDRYDGDTAEQERFPHQHDDEFSNFLETLDKTPMGALDVNELGISQEPLGTVLDELTVNGVNHNVAEAAETVLDRRIREWQTALCEDYPQDRVMALQPTTMDFLRVFQMWETVALRDGEHLNTDALPGIVDRVFRLFNLQNELVRRDGLSGAEPSIDTYETVLRILTSSRDRHVDRIVWSVFEEAPEKTAVMYTLVISRLAKSRNNGSAKIAEQVLMEAIEKFPPTMVDGEASGMTIDSFNVVLVAWAKSGLPYGPERAEKLIYIMDETDTRNGNHGLVKPNMFSFTSLIDAYAQKGDWDGASQSERILRSLLNQHMDGEFALAEPNVASWTIVISAWSRLSKKGFRRAAQRAGKLLDMMEQLYGEGKISYRPDAIVYASCLNAYSFSKVADGPAKAERLLDMTRDYYENGDESMKPSIKSIRMVIDSWIRSNTTDSMEEAELLLERYEEFLVPSQALDESSLPATWSKDVKDIYSNILVGWAKKGFPQEAQRYLQLMMDKGMHPDSIHYDRIIEANTLVNDENSFRRSYQVFQIMEQERSAGRVQPNERVYTSFIRAMTKAHIPKLAIRAHAMLQRMQHLSTTSGSESIQPTVFTRNAVLLACAESQTAPESDPLEAFKIAVRVFNEVRKGPEEPDHVTFGNMLRCAQLLPEGSQKENVIRSTFDLCCRTYQV